MTGLQIIDDYLLAIRTRLEVPAEPREAILSELRTHFYADIEHRMAAGLDEAAAATQAVAAMGDPRRIARELNRAHGAGGVTMLRTILAVQLAALGLLATFRGLTGLEEIILKPLARLTGPQKIAGDGQVVLAAWYRFWWNDATAEYHAVVGPLLAAAVMFVAGYVARRRGWLLGASLCAAVAATALPVWLSYPRSGSAFGVSVLRAAILAISVIVGAQLGATFYQSASRHRWWLLGGVAVLLGPVVGSNLVYEALFALHGSPLRVALQMAWIALVAALSTALALLLAKGLRRHPIPGAAE